MKRSEIARSDVARWSLLAIALLMAPVGLQAAVAPRSFFDDFPFGRGWISAGHAAIWGSIAERRT